jgi:phage baseplate assembly protein W
MIPQTSGITQYVIAELPTKTYRDTGERLGGIIDDRPALIQSLNHILSTERGAYPIYDNDYGVEFEQYIGASFDFVEASIEATVRDALLQDDRVTGVTLTSISRAHNVIHAEFLVNSNVGEITVGREINV